MAAGLFQSFLELGGDQHYLDYTVQFMNELSVKNTTPCQEQYQCTSKRSFSFKKSRTETTFKCTLVCLSASLPAKWEFRQTQLTYFSNRNLNYSCLLYVAHIAKLKQAFCCKILDISPVIFMFRVLQPSRTLFTCHLFFTRLISPFCVINLAAEEG